jgi:DnaK suppressor protein
MTNRELNHYKQMLENRRAEVESLLAKRDDIRIERAPDEVDQWQSAAAREFAVLSLDRDSRQIREINMALKRIAEGSYGYCVECEEEIGLKRLNAIPWACYCIACQQRIDERRAAGEAEEFDYDDDVLAAA